MRSNLPLWNYRLQEMQACKNATELVRRYGEPSHKVPHKDFEIWHYPLGVARATLYSIHVSVWPDNKMQIYMHMEPTNAPDSPLQRPRFSESARRGAREAFRFIGTLLGR